MLVLPTSRPSMASLMNETRTCNIADFISAEDNTYLYVVLCFSVMITVLYTFLQRRSRRSCGVDRPSILIPINLIQSTPERWIYVLIFGSLSGDLLLSIVSNGYGFTQSANATIYGGSLNTILLMFIVSFVFYPVFASVRSPIPILGYGIGFLYSTLVFCETYYRVGIALNGCIQQNNHISDIIVYIVLTALIPILLSHISVLMWYIWKIIFESYRLFRSQNPGQAIFELPNEHHSHNRVRWLLSKWSLAMPSEDDDGSDTDVIHQSARGRGGRYKKMLDHFRRKLKGYLYKYDPNIHYPLRFLAAIIIMIYITYILTLIVASLSFLYVVPLVDDVKSASDEVQRVIEVLEGSDIGMRFNVSNVISTIYDIILDSTYGLAVVIPFGPLFSFVACMALLVHMIGSVHIHLKKISLGNYDFLPEKLASPAYRLVHSMQFIGFQIGYFTWAWILLTISVWLVGMVGLITYFLLKFFFDIVIRIFTVLALPLIYSFGIYYFQLIFTKLFFVGDTNNKYTVINNLRLFHLFSYILIFQNAVVGITSAFIRILYAIFLGVLLLFRLDRVVLMKGFEHFDKGHKSYIGFLYLEHTLNNPVLRVFADLLLVGHRRRQIEEARAFRDKSTPLALTQMEDWIDDPCKKEVVTYPRTSQQVLNRWMVAYTLVHNPDLVPYTATQIKLKLNLRNLRTTRPDTETLVMSSEVTEREIGEEEDRERGRERIDVHIEEVEEEEPAIHAAVDELPEGSVDTFISSTK